MQLTATVLPDNAADKTVTWTSLNNAVAEVDDTGLVTARGEGSTEIRAVTQDGGKIANCAVIVSADTPSTGTAVTGITLNMIEAALALDGGAGASQQLTAIVQPPNAVNREVLWVSMNNAVAAVDSNGLVTARGAGSTLITAITRDGGKTASCFVTISETGRSNVSSVSVRAGNTVINVNWVNPTDADFTGVELSLEPAAGSLATPLTCQSPAQNYQVTGLSNGTIYTVRIRALYSSGEYSANSALNTTPSIQVTALDLTTLVTTPVKGQNAVTTPPPSHTEFESIAIAWQKPDGTPHTGIFLAGTEYTAALTIGTKDGFTFAGLQAANFTHTGAAAGGIQFTPSVDGRAGVITIAFPVTASVSISGRITAGGINCADAFVQLKAGGANYLTPAVSGADGMYTINGVAGGSYTIEVSKSSYATVTISSFPVTTVDVSGKNAALVVAATDTDILWLITPPTPGGTPSTMAGQISTQWTAGGVTWRTGTGATFSGNFEAGIAYRATVTLTALSGYSFEGVTAESFTYSYPGAVLTLTAPATATAVTLRIDFDPCAWDEVDVSAAPGAPALSAGIVAQLDWIKANGMPAKNYTVTAAQDETIAPQTLNVVTNFNLANVCITLKSDSTLRTITLASNGSLFAVTGF
ncbi:MAG: Ig-like domain-containing protein, partial [Spirochaetaceae bacterium]|nr:Ig-like domain-containing protein [Spirochaetaceae bacterium]